MSTITRFEDAVEKDQPEFGEKALRIRLGQLAKQRREEIGLGRIAFAKEAGLGSDKTVQDFEFGRRPISSRTQMRMERALGWRLGAIEDTLRDVNRKASSIQMEALDAEDSMHIALQQGSRPLSMVPDDELLDEVRRRMGRGLQKLGSVESQNLFDLAASTNNEHLEDEDPEQGD